MEMAEEVTIVVSGRVFSIERELLRRYPNSTLGRLVDAEEMKWTFSRPVSVFKSVLAYYQTGHLHIPTTICPGAVLDELDFWGFSANDLDACCKRALRVYFGTQSVVDTFEKEGKEIPISYGASSFSRARQHLWSIFDHPLSSRVAKVYYAVSILFIIASATAVVLATIPPFRGKMDNAAWKDYFGGDDDEDDYFYNYYYDFKFENKSMGNDTGNNTSAPYLRKVNPKLIYFGHSCTVFFVLEFVLKITCCPHVGAFFKSVLNIVDLLAIIAAVTEIAIERATPSEKYKDNYVDILRCLVVLRMVRLFRITQNTKCGRVLFYTLKTSYKELAFMLMLLIINVFIFGTLVFYFDTVTMKSIPNASWWAIVTMTTVGYGDVVPATGVGKLIGGICGCIGILIMALTLPLFVNNFTMLYAQVAESEITKTFTSRVKPRDDTINSVVEHNVKLDAKVS